MLQRRATHDVSGDWPAAMAPSEGMTLASLVPLGRRYGRLVLSTVTAFFFAALIYVMTATPSYVATTQLLIESQKGQPFMLEPGLLDLTIDNAHVESQVEVLRSERISMAVIRQLGLTADPEFRGAIDPGTEAERIRPAIANFGERLGVRRLGQSYVIEVAFRSRVASKATRVANAVVEAYLQDQIEAKAQTARQGTAWLQERIDELSVQLRDAARAVQQFRTVRDGGGAVEGIAVIDAETRLIELESRVLSFRKLQENMLQKLTETAQKQSLAVTNARVITPATTPIGKSSPKTRLVLAMSILAGGLVGVGLAMMINANDHSIRDGKALQVRTDLQVLAELPLFKVRIKLLGWLSYLRQVLRLGSDERVRRGRGSAFLAGVVDPASDFSDALRNAKVSLDVAGLAKPVRCIGITSVASGAGVSTVAASLAALYADSGVHTLLIDGSFRKPDLTRAFTAGSVAVETSEGPQVDGLVKLLRNDVDSVPLETGLATIAGTDIRFLPVGEAEFSLAGADLLGSNRMRELLERLRKIYAVTIIDLAALDRLADARAIAPSLDAIVLVAEHGVTQMAALVRAAEELEEAQAALVAVVINKVRQA